MKPSFKIQNVYHNNTTISIIDDSYEGNPNPDEVVFEIGFLKKKASIVKLGYGNTPSVPEFIDEGVPLYINSYTLGETETEYDKLKKFGTGVIEVKYYAYYTVPDELTIDSKSNAFTSELDLSNLAYSYDVIRLNGVNYTINKQALIPNKIFVKEKIDPNVKSTTDVMFGNLGVKYIVSKGTVMEKVSLIYTSLKEGILSGNDVCCNSENETMIVNLRNMVLLLKSVDYHCSNGNYLKIASILETIEATIRDKFSKYV